jgi:hypothetical protein
MSYLCVPGSLIDFVVPGPILIQVSYYFVSPRALLLGDPPLSSLAILFLNVCTSTVIPMSPTHALSSLGVDLFGISSGRLIDRRVPWQATLLDIIGYIALQVGAGRISTTAIVLACIGIGRVLTMP